MRALLAAVVLLATLLSRGSAQLSFGPIFSVSNPTTNETQTLVVRLSAPILTQSFVPSFTGRIEVDISAEDVPAGEGRRQASLGSDYIVNLQDFASRNFTVTFLSKQANSTAHVITIAEDSIFEGREYFRLRINAVRPIGQAAQFFIPQDGANNTFVDISIEDDDIVQVNWTTSQAIKVTEGDVVRLRGEAFGIYANEIAIGVDCSETIATDVEPAFPGRDFNFTVGTKLQFIDNGTTQSLSRFELFIPIINDDIAEPRESFICTLQGGTVDSVQAFFPSQVTIEICDDDKLIVRWAENFYEFRENELATVELVTDSKFETNVTILGNPRRIPNSDRTHLEPLEVLGPQLFPGVISLFPIERAFYRGITFGRAQVTLSGRTDVESTFNDFLFTPVSNSSFDSFIIVDDIVLEFDELLIATFDFGPEIANNWNVCKGSPNVTYIIIRDDDFVEVCFKESNYSVNESAGQVSVSLHITGQFFIPLHAFIEVIDGTATDPEDYSSAGRYRVDFRQTTFTDTDTPAPFADSLPITINITDDIIFDGLEYFQARIVGTSDLIRVRICQQDTVNITILDDDNVTVHYEDDLYSVCEEAGVVSLALVLEGDATIPVTVSVNTLNLTNSSVGDAATAVLDYLPRTPSDITFPAGSKRQLYNVTIVDDIFPENSEYFNADVNARPEDASRVLIGSPKQPLIEIQDKVDQEVEVYLDQTAYSIFENETNVTVTLRLSNGYREDIAVLVAVGELAGVDALYRAQAGVDFSTAGYPLQVTIPAGQTSVQFTVMVTDELIVEKDELFQLNLTYSDGQPGVEVRTGFDKANITIKNDDVLTVMFDPADYEVSEGRDVQLILVTNNPYSFNFTINVTTQDGSAVSPADYIGSSFIASFTPSLIVPGLFSVMVSTNPDNALEGLEYFSAVLSVPAEFPDVLEGVPSVARVNITDATIAGVFFDPEAYMVPEGENVTLILKTNVTVNKRFRVLVNTVDDSANSPSDYQGGEKRAIFEIGSNMTTVQYTTAGDGIQEGLETFTVELTVPPDMQAMGIFAGMPDTAMVHIVDDDNLTCMLVRTMHEVREDEGDLNVTVMCGVPSEDPFTLLVRSTDGTAIEGEDYTGKDFFIMFSPGSTKESFKISIINDDVFEFDEMFSLALEIPQSAQNIGVMRGVPFMANVTIINDELPVVIDIEQRVIDVIENQKQVEVCLVKNGTSSRPIMALVGAQEIMDGAGSPGSMGALDEEDFESEPNVSSIVMMGSETKKCANINIIDDKTVEMIEPFEFIITFPPGQEAIDSGEIVPAAMQLNGIINIIDDDEITVQFAQDMYMVRESDGMVDVMVVASEKTSFSYKFTVTPMDITATNAVDYVFSSTVYEFLPADVIDPIPSTVISIPIIPDDVDELDETFKLTIVVSAEARASNIIEGEINMTAVLIKDDNIEELMISLDSDDYSVREDVGTFMATITATRAVDFPYTVTVGSVDGTAVEGADYQLVDLQLEFLPGEVRVEFNVTIVDNNIIEREESFLLLLSISDDITSKGVQLGPNAEATVTITDNDDIDNDTVRGGPLFSIPLPSKYLTDPDLKSIQLCYEVHGVSGNHYNLISDNCTSVSARYSQGVSDAKLNVITEIGIKSQGGNGTCHTIEVDLNQCHAYLDGVFRSTTSTISVNGITMTIRRKHVRVSLPNCHSSRKLILWMMCMMRNSEDMMELVVARGDGLEPTAHGLIGQFWNIPLTIEPYVGPYGDGSVVKSDKKYTVTTSYPGAQNRTFVADYNKRDWLDNRHCLYAGNHNAGPIGEVKGYGSVIEGKANDYVVAGLFSTDFTFSKYNGNC